MTIEREEDTWVSLTSTPLTGWEIVRGKAVGIVWSQRGFLAVPVGLWTFGLVTGSVHPVGFLGALVALGVISWMVASVGVNASLRAPSTSRALASTLVRLAVLYGYPIVLFRAFFGEYLWNEYAAFIGWPPRIAVGPLVSYVYFAELLRSGPREIFGTLHPRWGVAVLVFYAMVAGYYTFRSVGQFDRQLDRPRMSSRSRVAIEPAGPFQEVEPLLQS